MSGPVEKLFLFANNQNQLKDVANLLQWLMKRQILHFHFSLTPFKTNSRKLIQVFFFFFYFFYFLFFIFFLNYLFFVFFYFDFFYFLAWPFRFYGFIDGKLSFKAQPELSPHYAYDVNKIEDWIKEHL